MSAASEFILNALDADRAVVGVGCDESEFARLLVLQQPHLARLVQRLLGWPAQMAEVDDIVQEVMVSAWTHRGSFRGDSQLATWLTRISINQVRRHRRRIRLFARLFRRHGDLTSVPAVSETPDERSEELRKAMAQLAHRDREILVLHYLEGRSVADIAALLGLANNTTHARMSRARRRLARVVGIGEQHDR